MADREQRFSFRGSGGELFGIYIVNIILTGVTLGIYSFWARVKIQKYLYQKTYFLNENFDYHATGQELFLGFLKGAAVVIGAMLVYTLVAYVLTMLMGESGGLVALLLLYAAIIGALPFLIIGSTRFHLSRSSWRNLRFHFSGTPAELQKDFYTGVLLTIVTLGIYGPWFTIKMRKFFTNKSNYGNQAFRFEGDGMELFKIYLVGFLLTIVTLGIYSFWLQASLIRYFAENTSVQGKNFRSDITGGQILGTTILTLLMIVFSLGLAFPWAIVMLQKLYLETTALEGAVDLDQIEGRKDGGASSLSDGIGDAADAVGTILG
ncbi:MAG: YjgN family protein [bacterium]|nr:YjgN family protein [bacterium]